MPRVTAKSKSPKAENACRTGGVSNWDNNAHQDSKSHGQVNNRQENKTNNWECAGPPNGDPRDGKGRGEQCCFRRFKPNKEGHRVHPHERHVHPCRKARVRARGAGKGARRGVSVLRRGGRTKAVRYREGSVPSRSALRAGNARRGSARTGSSSVRPSIINQTSAEEPPFSSVARGLLNSGTNPGCAEWYAAASGGSKSPSWVTKMVPPVRSPPGGFITQLTEQKQHNNTSTMEERAPPKRRREQGIPNGGTGTESRQLTRHSVVVQNCRY